MSSSLEKKVAGLGIRVQQKGNGLYIVHVTSGGAAAAASPFLKEGDRIISLDGTPVYTEDDVKKLAAGPDGSPVVVSCQERLQTTLHTLTLVRGVPGAHQFHIQHACSVEIASKESWMEDGSDSAVAKEVPTLRELDAMESSIVTPSDDHAPHPCVDPVQTGAGATNTNQHVVRNTPARRKASPVALQPNGPHGRAESLDISRVLDYYLADAAHDCTSEARLLEREPAIQARTMALEEQVVEQALQLQRTESRNCGSESRSPESLAGQVSSRTEASIRFKDLTFFSSVVGSGSYKTVYKATLRSGSGTTEKITTVAAAQMRESTCDPLSIRREVGLLKELGEHPYLPLLHGIAKDPEGMIYVVSEFFSLGSLDAQLEILGAGLSLSVRLCLGLQIAHALDAIHRKGILHRDLATRNVLVHCLDPTNVARVWVKVSDFGLARLGTQVHGQEAIVPWRWTSPEVHQQHYWCQASDIWAFGVTLWEIFSNACVPFHDISDDEELKTRVFTEGIRLHRPPSCPASLFTVLQRCWRHSPSARPTVADLIMQLQQASSALVHDGDLFEL